MCGIFGIIPFKRVKPSNLKILVNRSMQRGLDSSGFYIINNGKHIVSRASFSLDKLINQTNLNDCTFIACHTRLITNSSEDNQPVKRDSIIALHNGIIINHNSIWEKINSKPKYGIDSEIIPSLFSYFLKKKVNLGEIPHKVFEICEGSISCALIIEKIGKLVLLSNTGSLYFGEKDKDYFFASERYTLDLIKCKNIEQIKNHFKIIDIQSNSGNLTENSFNSKRTNYVPSLNLTGIESSLLKHEKPKLLRCKKCILPETMPFISFNSEGVCNYCENYELRNIPKDKSLLFDLVEKYRKPNGNDCLLPFSGGRDSCYGLHLAVKELKVKPLAYTYDWGMVTDLGRRNISRMCSKLGVENIIIAADISKKRKHIANNISAWLKSPHLGMVSIFTAGDKHFFRHIETVKKQNDISLNLWGINPLEVTHFKAGFLGVPPDFEEKKVYSSGGLKQLKYQRLRFGAMTKSFGYFNSSIWDTISGEYYRSYHKKSDYFHIFDYWRWDENVINNVLLNEYDWEMAEDTKTTWRIGDGTAAFYNYIYYTLAGFTEHDTFRSNQIREGQISRDEALKLVQDENKPRYPNLQWYLDTIGLDFESVISRINSLPRNYFER